MFYQLWFICMHATHLLTLFKSWFCILFCNMQYHTLHCDINWIFLYIILYIICLSMSCHHTKDHTGNKGLPFFYVILGAGCMVIVYIYILSVNCIFWYVCFSNTKIKLSIIYLYKYMCSWMPYCVKLYIHVEQYLSLHTLTFVLYISVLYLNHHCVRWHNFTWTGNQIVLHLIPVEVNDTTSLIWIRTMVVSY